MALRIASELTISMRYKLRMFGIPLVGTTILLCNNEAVYTKKKFTVYFNAVGVLLVGEADQRARPFLARTN